MKDTWLFEDRKDVSVTIGYIVAVLMEKHGYF